MEKWPVSMTKEEVIVARNAVAMIGKFLMMAV
jgi:hypothetical protein